MTKEEIEKLTLEELEKQKFYLDMIDTWSAEDYALNRMLVSAIKDKKNKESCKGVL